MMIIKETPPNLVLDSPDVERLLEDCDYAISNFSLFQEAIDCEEVSLDTYHKVADPLTESLIRMTRIRSLLKRKISEVEA